MKKKNKEKDLRNTDSDDTNSISRCKRKKREIFKEEKKYNSYEHFNERKEKEIRIQDMSRFQKRRIFP